MLPTLIDPIDPRDSVFLRVADYTPAQFACFHAIELNHHTNIFHEPASSNHYEMLLAIGLPYLHMFPRNVCDALSHKEFTFWW
jgi:hypothetical protein